MNASTARTAPSGFGSRNGDLLLGPDAVRRSRWSRAKVPCCRIWPNGEFGLSWHTKEEEVEPLASNPAGGSSLEHQRLMCLVLRLENEYLKAVARVCLYPWLVKSAKSAQRPKTYGRKGITGYGSKVVRNGAYLLQEKYGKNRLAFLTLTVPSFGAEAETRIAENWGYLLKVLIQGLRRLLRRVGLPESIVGVTELQPKRLEGREPGCLHLHLVFVGGWGRGRWAYSPFVYRSLWLRMLYNLLGFEMLDMPCENVEAVKKDASNYLGKYMSKGVVSVAQYAEIVGWERVPRQWWSATKSIKKAVKERTISGEKAGRILDEIIYSYWKKGGVPNTMGCVFVRPITIEGTKYQDIVIGMFGKIDRETYDDIKGLTRLVKSA